MQHNIQHPQHHHIKILQKQKIHEKQDPHFITRCNYSTDFKIEESDLNLILLQIRDAFQLTASTELLELLGTNTTTVLSEASLNYLIDSISSITQLITTLIKSITNNRHNQTLLKFRQNIEKMKLNLLQDPTSTDNLGILQKDKDKDQIQSLQDTIEFHQLKYQDICSDAFNASAKHSNYVINNTYEHRYAENWYKAKIDQFKTHMDTIHNNLEKQKVDYQNRILREQLTVDSYLDFLNASNLTIRKKMNSMTNQFEEATRKLDDDLNYAEREKSGIESKYNDALKMLEDHRKWVTLTRRNDAAIMIQTKWREILKTRADIRTNQEELLIRKQQYLDKIKTQQETAIKKV